MAIIKCPNCGRQITDRMEKCPHCNAILKDNNKYNEDKIKVTLVDNIVGVVTALIFSFALFFLKQAFENSLITPFGDMPVIANSISKTLYFQKGFPILIIGAGLFCGVSKLLHKKSSTQFAAGVVLAISLGIVGNVWLNQVVHNSIGLYIRETYWDSVLYYINSLAFGYGFAYTVFFGSASLISFGRKIKYSVLMQFCCSIGYFFISVVLEYIFLRILDFRSGWLIANTLSSVLVIGFAALTNKGFQQLITPKKIS